MNCRVGGVIRLLCTTYLLSSNFSRQRGGRLHQGEVPDGGHHLALGAIHELEDEPANDHADAVQERQCHCAQLLGSASRSGISADLHACPVLGVVVNKVSRFPLVELQIAEMDL